MKITHTSKQRFALVPLLIGHLVNVNLDHVILFLIFGLAIKQSKRGALQSRVVEGLQRIHEFRPMKFRMTYNDVLQHLQLMPLVMMTIPQLLGFGSLQINTETQCIKLDGRY